jgi:hypothetical protein
MKSDNTDRIFPAIRLADGPQADNPAATHRRMLSELAERLDQYNVSAVEAAHRKPKSLFAPIFVVIQKTERLFDSVTHSLGSSSADSEKIRHFVERQAFTIKGQGPGEFENCDRFFQPHYPAPEVNASNIDVSIFY